MIPFERLTLDKKPEYDALLRHASHRGCAFSFANLYLWGRQCAARVGENLLIFSHFGGKTMYPFPAGPDVGKDTVELLMADAAQRGIPLRLTGLNTHDVEQLEVWFPGRFRFHCGRDGHEYVYAIDDLADLKGKKYQPKRNHINRFLGEYPDAVILPLSDETQPDAVALADRWYQQRSAEEDAAMEHAALRRAFAHWKELGMVGLVLYVDGQAVAMTMGSFLGEDTVDVHFEKADLAFPGAYAVINRAFARHVREHYPQVQYLNREEDMGLEGLRKAKLSYYPHHMVEKCWAHLMTEEFHDY
ncbi:MAG: DUF2156 domain-containing protein [Oscillospiraceae bacterium]|nr:DUF2156 domain-containing protein [Oscillospiraceae bacterium]